MLKEELLPILKVLKSVYTDPKFIPDGYAAETWFTVLHSFDINEVKAAVQEYLSSGHYAPVPADIVQLINKRARRNSLDAQGIEPLSAWNTVRKSARVYEDTAVEMYEKLPGIIQKVIGSPAYLVSLGCMSIDQIEVEKSHFLRSYEAALKENKIISSLPKSLQPTLAETDRRERIPDARQTGNDGGFTEAPDAVRDFMQQLKSRRQT